MYAAVVSHWRSLRIAGNNTKTRRKQVDLDQLQFNWSTCESRKAQRQALCISVYEIAQCILSQLEDRAGINGASPGYVCGRGARLRVEDFHERKISTSAFSVIDQQGNWLSLGSCLWRLRSRCLRRHS